jgi:hypothetical protein
VEHPDLPDDRASDFFEHEYVISRSGFRRERRSAFDACREHSSAPPRLNLTTVTFIGPAAVAWNVMGLPPADSPAVIHARLAAIGDALTTIRCCFDANSKLPLT